MLKQTVAFFALILVIILFCGGCNKDILDPTQIGRFRPVPVVNVILESLGVADEPEPTYAGAEDPRPEDIIDPERDYVFGPGDIVRISIYELRRQGVPFVDSYIVTETGRVSIPDVGQIRAEGLTEVELEEEIKNILQPGILLDPSVTVALLESQSRIFSISGQAVARPNRYPIPRYNYRLMDAIATAGGVAEFNADYIYVSRDVSGDETQNLSANSFGSMAGQTAMELDGSELRSIEPAEQNNNASEDILEIIAPHAKKTDHNNHIVISTAEMATQDELAALADPDALPGQNDLGTDEFDDALSIAESSTGRVEWIYENGKWKAVRVGQPEPEPFAASEKDFNGGLEEIVPTGYGWNQIGTAGTQTRVIKIPVDRLLGGDPRYNVVIRPGDSVTVPVNIIGEFCVTGNVNSSGYIPLTGRPMTLMQAIAAAGGLGPLAWPKKVEVKRRIGRNSTGLMQELTVMVDLEKIAKGVQPDFFIKPNDTINVGSHGTSRWLAVLRNAFRATYGFGFVYDRNFAELDFGNDPFPGHVSLDNIF